MKLRFFLSNAKISKSKRLTKKIKMSGIINLKRQEKDVRLKGRYLNLLSHTHNQTTKILFSVFLWKGTCNSRHTNDFWDVLCRENRESSGSDFVHNMELNNNILHIIQIFFYVNEKFCYIANLLQREDYSSTFELNF